MNSTTTAGPTPTEWRAAMLRSPALNDRTKLVMVVLADRINADGLIIVEREEVASALGWLHVQRVSERLTEARNKGFLDLVKHGGRGKPAQFSPTLPSALLGRKEALSIRDTRTATETMQSGHVRTERGFPSGVPGALLKVTAESNHAESAPGAATTVLGIDGSSSPNPSPEGHGSQQGTAPRATPITPTTANQHDEQQRQLRALEHLIQERVS